MVFLLSYVMGIGFGALWLTKANSSHDRHSFRNLLSYNIFLIICFYLINISLFILLIANEEHIYYFISNIITLIGGFPIAFTSGSSSTTAIIIFYSKLILKH